MAWLGLLELVLWAAICIFAVEKVYPWLEGRVVDTIPQRDDEKGK